MFTLIAAPKPFQGHFAIIQRNAIESWSRLSPRPQIVLIGDEPGIAEMAEEVGAVHIRHVSCNEYGTPLMNDVFARGEAVGGHDIICFVNSDIILMNDFTQTVEVVSRRMDRFLLIGRRWDTDIRERWDFDSPDWEQKLRAHAREVGRLHPPTGMDYFVYRRGMWKTLPPLAIGRIWIDCWLVWMSRHLGIPVIEASTDVLAIHQNHDYSHAGYFGLEGADAIRHGTEANENLRILGSRRRNFSNMDATWVVENGQVRRLWFRPYYHRLVAQNWHYVRLMFGFVRHRTRRFLEETIGTERVRSMRRYLYSIGRTTETPGSD